MRKPSPCSALRDATLRANPGLAMPAQISLAHPTLAALGQAKCGTFVGAQ